MELRKFFKIVCCYSIVLFFAAFNSIVGQSKVTVGNIDPGQIDCKGFTLYQESTIKIEGTVGGFRRSGNKVYYYGWILNSRTRDVVWHLLDKRLIRDMLEKGTMFNFRDSLKLPAGDYEVYYAGGSSDERYGLKTSVDFLQAIFGGDSEEYRLKYKSKLSMTVMTDNNYMVSNDGKLIVDQMSLNSVASLIRAGDGQHLQKKFGLSDRTVLDIYAIGEGRGTIALDYAWIYDAQTYKRAWQMDPRLSEYAGGSDKNMMFDSYIILPKGNYILNYVTDDSHSYDGWDSMPPDDPQFWGVTVWAHSSADAQNIVPYDEAEINQPFVQITQVGNDENIGKGFELAKDMSLRILALGEWQDTDEFSDYAWILNAETNKIVWSMKQNTDSKYAGGALKNRIVEEKISLPKGKYFVYYVTDGSHAYDSWNAAPPIDPDKYGVTIWTVDKADRDYVKDYEPYGSENK